MENGGVYYRNGVYIMVNIMKKQIRFSIHQGMRCASYEAEKRIYKLKVGKSGRKWLIACQPNEADNIYVEGSGGFGGRTINFLLEDNTIISLTGCWHANADSLFEDANYDIRNKYETKGIIALKREYDYYKGDLYFDILHYDKKNVIGEFDRIKKLAQDYSNKLQQIVYYADISSGGGSSSLVKPEKAELK